MTLLKMCEALLALTDEVYHFEAPQGTQAPYIIYGEDADVSLWADNKKVIPTVQGTIDLYCKDDLCELIKFIPNALENKEISYYLNSIQHEEETGLLHYEWVFEVIDDGDD